MEWSIQQIARLAGTTSRTLRHYDQVGLVPPSRVGENGYRYYDARSLIRLQRVLLLRELGLGLKQIRQVLDRETDESAALHTHLALLRREQNRLKRQIAAVEHTIVSLKGRDPLMAEAMFEGFDHTEYKDEVEQRWGADAYAQSDRWWRSLSAAEQKQWLARVAELNRDWITAHEAGVTPDSPEAQALAQRHLDWLRGVPGTPQGDFRGYVRGLLDLYVADERFAANYGGRAGAGLVRAAVRSLLDRSEAS